MTLYMAGARMVHYYPVSIPSHGSGLNITVQSYAGLLEFGLTACRRVVSQDESYEIVAHLQAALREIEALATIHADAGVESAAVEVGSAGIGRAERSDQTEQGLHEEDRRSTAEGGQLKRAGEPINLRGGTNMQPTAANQSSPLFESGALKTLFSKIDRRLIPILLISYMIAYLDRVNIGYAQLQMKQTLPFDDAVYGLGAGMFFIGYFLFEVPSNLLLERIGARKTLLRIMVLWGLTASAMMFVSTPLQFYVARFLLGVFEAGFFPGVILYFTYWYPSVRRGRVIAIFMSATTIMGVITGPLCGATLKYFDGFGGLHGWQWLFLVQGLPAISSWFSCVSSFWKTNLPMPRGSPVTRRNCSTTASSTM